MDVHTVSSVHLGVNALGHDIYDTKRSEIGELLFQLKYRDKLSASRKIVEAASSYLKRSRSKFDLIVPVPPSGPRKVQPVELLAQGIGDELKLPVVDCVTTRRAATPLKGVVYAEERLELMQGLYEVNRDSTVGKRILLFDDFFRSGTTLKTITDLLMSDGCAQSVRVLTITRTRSNR